jgi:Na+/glutamate symporter
MVAALLTPDLFVGLGFGLVLGLLIGPVVRSWLIWREWVSASREANLVADVLDRMEVAPSPQSEPDEKATDAAHLGTWQNAS